MSEESAAHLTNNPPVMLDVDSEMNGPGDSADTAGSLDDFSTLLVNPKFEAHVENLVKLRLTEFERQTIAQMKAWKDQEAEMRAREQQLLEEFKALKDRLAAAETASAIQPSAAIPSTEEARSVVAVIPAKRRKTASAVAQLNETGYRRARSTSRQNVAEIVATTAVRRGPSLIAAAPATVATPITSGGETVADGPPPQPQPRSRPPPQPPVIGNQPRSTRVTRSASRRNVDSTANLVDGTNHAPASFGAYPFTFLPSKGTKTRKKKAVVKAVAEIFRYLPQDMPEDMGGLKKAIALHIRILWGLTDAKEVPKNPPAKVLVDFHRRFTSEQELYACQTSGQELIPRRLVVIGTAMSTGTGRIAIQSSLLEEHMLEYIQVCLARFGLTCWCPDLRLSAYSLYNSALRIVAIDTFKQALVSHAYAHLGPNTKYASNMKILVLLFDHFVFHYMKGRYQKEDRNPGMIAEQLQKSPQYMARIRLACARHKFLAENNYPQRYRDLIKTKATSDDEPNPNRKNVWIIKRRPERSAKAEQFIRLLDARRREAALQRGSRYWRERTRVVPSVQEDSPFHGLPERMPIDYFDPTYFNKLQPKTRNRIAVVQASLLPDVDQSFTWNADERMTDKAFTRKYGTALFAQYTTVSDADLADDEDDGSEDEWAGIPDEDTMTQKAEGEDLALDINTLTTFRENIASHLSEPSGSHASSQINFSSNAALSESSGESMESIYN